MSDDPVQWIGLVLIMAGMGGIGGLVFYLIAEWIFTPPPGLRKNRPHDRKRG